MAEMQGRKEGGSDEDKLGRASSAFLLLLLLLSHFSRVRLCETLWTAAHQAPLSTGFSRQEYWSGLLFPSLEGRGRQKEKVTLFY